MLEDIQNRVRKLLHSDEIPMLTKVVIALVATSGVLAVGIMAPNIFQVARQFKGSQRYSKSQIQRTIFHLKKKGLLSEIENKHGKKSFVLTEQGQKYLENMVVWDIEIPRPRRWDKKWRFVIFDIPINYTKAREALRWRLRVLGFYQYQKSVWAYPYPCAREIGYITEFFGVGKHVDLFEAEHITREEELKKHFRL